MKKLGLIIGGVSLLGAGGAYAITCTSSPSCSDLGYTSNANSCGGDYLVCPFDTSKVYCIQCPEQCTELGFNKVASNGTYTCSEGQTIEKCPQNQQKYRCNGTACNYGYYLNGNSGMARPTCSYKLCCTERQTYGNTSCWHYRDNTSNEKYTREYVECQAASYSGYGDLPYVGTRTYNGGTYKDACGNAQYEVKYYCMKDDCIGYNCGNNNSCNWQTPSCTYKSWYSGSYDDSGYQSDCTQNPCFMAWQEEQYGYNRYEYNGVEMGFSEYCYKKYNLQTSCGGLKFMGETIPWDFDYY